jgi:CPA2 family monovalent cation:H+ antiporter-2
MIDQIKLLLPSLESARSNAEILHTLAPTITILFLGVVASVVSRSIKINSIVGYIALGALLSVSGLGASFDHETISVLAELGVVFLLFDIGLHFSIDHIRKQASDIFAFGPTQVLFATIVIGLVALVFGMGTLSAFLIGAVLALSSTAVVERIIAEHHQKQCPVGVTAMSILVFQDVAAIFLLIIVGSLEGGGPIWSMVVITIMKAVFAFLVTVLLARLAIGPLLKVIARTRDDEIFTATALLIALAAGWATGKIGLSLTLGAFLGGLMLAETPYRAVIETEIKPFRGLLLSFFFISIGLSLDINVLGQSFLTVIGLAVLLLVLKIGSNIAASRVFRWSVPGSTQIGFLLAQGSEFAFVVLSVPAVRTIVGEANVSIIVAAVVLSIAVTPNLASCGRKLAGYMRHRALKTSTSELTPGIEAAPILIVGMGTVGRTVADALTKFKIDYCGIERNHERLELAMADGYNVVLGDESDGRIWKSVGLEERKMSVLTKPNHESQRELSELAKESYPHLKRFVVLKDDSESEEFRSIGLHPIVDQGLIPGVLAAARILSEWGVAQEKIQSWIDERSAATEPISRLEKIVA